MEKQGIDIQISEAQRKALADSLAGVANGVAIAVTSAVNRTLRTGRTILRRRIQQIVNIKTAYFNDRAVSIMQATRSTQQGYLKISRNQIPLIQFGARAGKTGVSVEIKKGMRERHPHWFKAKMASGHEGIFKRFGPKVPMTSGYYAPSGPHNRSGRVLRQRITEIKGPSILGVYQNAPAAAAEVLSDIGTELQKNLDSQVDRLLQRKKADRPA